MITASYVSEEMKALDAEAKAKNLTFLNECGVDPGIDHLATMKVIDEAKEKNQKILEYESWCGGLPSPEFVDNPLGYKFTWSPIGALGALTNDARILHNNSPKDILGPDLLYHAKTIDINMALNLEGYPNRDATKYKELYGLNDCTHLMRGTLRYAGFSVIMNSFKAVGLFSKVDKVPIDISFKDFIHN